MDKLRQFFDKKHQEQILVNIKKQAFLSKNTFCQLCKLPIQFRLSKTKSDPKYCVHQYLCIVCRLIRNSITHQQCIGCFDCIDLPEVCKNCSPPACSRKIEHGFYKHSGKKQKNIFEIEDEILSRG